MITFKKFKVLDLSQVCITHSPTSYSQVFNLKSNNLLGSQVVPIFSSWENAIRDIFSGNPDKSTGLRFSM